MFQWQTHDIHHSGTSWFYLAWFGLVWFYGIVGKCQLHFYTYKQFYFKQFSLAHDLVLIDPYIEPYQVIPLCVRADQGPMTRKGYSALPVVSLLKVISRTLVRRVLPSAEKLSEYSAALADWATTNIVKEKSIFLMPKAIRPTHTPVLRNTKCFFVSFTLT